LIGLDKEVDSSTMNNGCLKYATGNEHHTSFEGTLKVALILIRLEKTHFGKEIGRFKTIIKVIIPPAVDDVKDSIRNEDL